MSVTFTVLLVALQWCSAKDGNVQQSPFFQVNSNSNYDPFESDPFFTSQDDAFNTMMNNPFDVFKNDPFFNPPPSSSTVFTQTFSNNQHSSSDSDGGEQSNHHKCTACNSNPKKKAKVGDLFAGAVPVSIMMKPPSFTPPAYSSTSYPPSGNSQWVTGAAMAGGGLTAVHLTPNPQSSSSSNYYGTSNPTHTQSSSSSSSKPLIHRKPKKHHSSSSSSSSSSSEDKHKHTSSGSAWSTGAAVAGGAVAGGLLASTSSKPSTSPNYYGSSSTHGVHHAPSKHDSSSGSGWSTGAALAGGALAGGLLASSSTSKPAYTNGNQLNPQPSYQAHKPHRCSYCIREKCDPASCREAANFNAKSDAERLQKAIKGLGTDEKTIIEILTQRSDEQIEEIRQEYVRSGRTMSSDLHGDTSFKTKELLDALVTPRSLFYAEQLEHAFKNKDTDTMIEIFTSLSDCAIREVSSEYTKRFRKALPESIEKKTCLDFEKFLLELAKGNRSPNGQVDVAAAKKDANALISAGVGKWFGTDEDKFIKIFATRSWVQLKEVLKQYDLKRKSGIEKDIKSETSGKLQKGLLTLVKNIKDQPSYFAQELENSLATLIMPGPNDNHKLIRIMRGRCGVDLGDIRDAYPRTFKGKKLASRLSSKTYMDYQAALLAMIKK